MSLLPSRRAARCRDRRADVLAWDSEGGRPGSASHEGRFEKLVGKAAEDERLFARKRKEGETQEKIRHRREARLRESHQLTNLVKEGETTVSSLEQVKGPFEKAVKNSDACQALKPSQDEQS